MRSLVEDGTHPLLNQGDNHPVKIKVICPHCGKIGPKPQMIQWHFDNCKLKPMD